MPPKLGKFKRPWPKCNQFQRCQDISAHQILGHSFHALLRKSPKPQIWPVSLSQMVPRWGQSTDRDQNLISSEGGQDIWTCQISGHSSHAFWRNCLEAANLTCFTKSKCHQNVENQQTMSKSALKVVRKHVKFQAIQVTAINTKSGIILNATTSNK